MAEGETLKNAGIGAAVSIVLFFLLLSPVLGGAVAGYLQRGDGAEGARVGALSGLIAAVPGTLLAVLVVSVFTVAPPGGGGMGFFAVVVLGSLLVVGLYGAALGAVGGLVGAYVARERDETRRTDPETG